MRPNLFACALGLCLPLTGCSTSYDVEIAGPLSEPTVAFVRAKGPNQVCADELSVRHGARVIWAIRSVREPCGVIGALTFGRVPEGFSETVPAEPLAADTPYEVLGRGWGRGIPWSGSATAIFRDGSWRVDNK